MLEKIEFLFRSLKAIDSIRQCLEPPLESRNHRDFSF